MTLSTARLASIALAIRGAVGGAVIGSIIGGRDGAATGASENRRALNSRAVNRVSSTRMCTSGTTTTTR